MLLRTNQPELALSPTQPEFDTAHANKQQEVLSLYLQLTEFPSDLSSLTGTN